MFGGGRGQGKKNGGVCRRRSISKKRRAHVGDDWKTGGAISCSVTFIFSPYARAERYKSRRSRESKCGRRKREEDRKSARNRKRASKFVARHQLRRRGDAVAAAALSLSCTTPRSPSPRHDDGDAPAWRATRRRRKRRSDEKEKESEKRDETQRKIESDLQKNSSVLRPLVVLLLPPSLSLSHSLSLPLSISSLSLSSLFPRFPLIKSAPRRRAAPS